jgi:putative phosphoribosyl transferase
MMRVFRDRHDAGARLASALHRYTDAMNAIVLAHTRTSVPVAYEVAIRLGLPLDVLPHKRCELARGTRVDIYAHESIELAALDIDVDGKLVILVDDGDGARNMAVAIETLRAHGAATIVAASAVAAPHVFAMLQAAADDVVVELTPQRLFSIEAWYADLAEPTDDEIHHMLVAAAQSQLVLRRSNFLTSSVDT